MTRVESIATERFDTPSDAFRWHLSELQKLLDRMDADDFARPTVERRIQECRDWLDFYCEV